MKFIEDPVMNRYLIKSEKYYHMFSSKSFNFLQFSLLFSWRNTIHQFKDVKNQSFFIFDHTKLYACGSKNKESLETMYFVVHFRLNSEYWLKPAKI